MKIKFTRLAFKWHGWLGITAGMFFLLFSVTGSMLMFRNDLDRYLNPELHHLKPRSRQVSADSMYQLIVRTHPNLKKIVLHDFPSNKYDCYEFMLYQNQWHLTDTYLYYVFVNPYTGKIIREGSHADMAPMFLRWLYTFHYSLQLGYPGMLFTGFIGLVMLLSLLSGIVIYRKQFWDAVRFKGGLNFKNRRTAVSSLHRIVGVWAILSTAILFFTGFWMNREFFSPSEWRLTKPHQNFIAKANIDSLVRRSERLAPGFKPIAVNIPCVAGQDISVRGEMPYVSSFLLHGKASSLTFDAKTGAFKKLSDISKQDFDKQFEVMAYQLHIGAYGGNFLRWVYVVLGLLPGFLSVTGAILWFKRMRRKRA